MNQVIEAGLPLAAWAALWGLGGIWIARSAFNLRPNEQILAGIGVGLILQTWLANILSQFTAVPAAFWAASTGIFLAGLAFSMPFSRENFYHLFQIPIKPMQVLILLFLAYLFTSAGRGVALLDDYQNLPVASLIAAGDIPPHFPLDPSRIYGYHYLTLLLAAQLARIGDLFIWTALDAARGFSFALVLALTGTWVRRVTGSILAGYISGIVTAFSSGTRWLLLLLPDRLLEWISADIYMIGSGANSGQDLTAALMNPWATSEGGVYPFPFIHVNGFNPAGVMSFHSGAGSLPGIITVLFLLTHNRWKGWRAGVISAALLSALALANEVGFIAIAAGLLLAAGLQITLNLARWKKAFIPLRLRYWLLLFIPAGLAAAFQGGVLSGIVSGWIGQMLPGTASGEAYHTFQFSLTWPPALISGHLGSLFLTRPAHLLAAFVEIGPILLVLPLLVIWAIKAFRFKRWYEIGYLGFGLASAASIFIMYSGTAGPTALTRIQGILPAACTLFAVPVLWFWLQKRADTVKILAGILFLSATLSGAVLFGIQIISAPRPIISNYLSSLDARVSRDYWDRLEAGKTIFDPIPYRSPVVFGRATSSSTNQYQETEAWGELRDHPSAQVLNGFGFSYAFLDKAYWESIPSETQEQLDHSCMTLIQEYTQVFPEDFRRLYDLRGCRKDLNGQK